jgi:F-type H+-transporting ATPase subunit c
MYIRWKVFIIRASKKIKHRSNEALLKEDMIMAFIQLLAAALAIGLGAIGAGLAMGQSNGKAYEAIGRNPEAMEALRTNFMMGLALSETIVVFSLVMSMMILLH